MLVILVWNLYFYLVMYLRVFYIVCRPIFKIAVQHSLDGHLIGDFIIPLSADFDTDANMRLL